jgi:hypothetical protein
VREFSFAEATETDVRKTDRELESSEQNNYFQIIQLFAFLTAFCNAIIVMTAIMISIAA